jgi:photosystem II stability/assembly factor-like uncharacterized protein
VITPLAIILFVTALAATIPSQSPVDRDSAWRLHQEMAGTSAYKGMSWRPIGPRLQGGRIEAIAVHPSKPHTIYVGPGSGNIWKTENNGSSWIPIFENESTFTIGDIAIAPSNPDILWVGTGETQPRHSGYSFAGTGVFVSRDAGRTWENTGLAETHHIGKVLIHPTNPDIVYIGAIGHFWSNNTERGVYKTTDGGKTWDKTLFISDTTGVVDIAMHPSNPDILVAAAWQVTHGKESGLYKSTDAGDSWTKITKGLPGGPTGRSGLAFSASHPNTIYAFVDDWTAFEGKRQRKIVGAAVYRSDDQGSSWRKTNTEDLYSVFTIYGWKFCDVRVNPKDPDEIFILGNRAYHSRDSGKTFVRIGEKILRIHDTKGTVMHLDHHDLWIDPSNPSRLILGNDGGLFISSDRGKSWLHVNNLPIGEFYFVAADMAKPYRIYGGTQDNAALYGPAKGIDPFRNDPWQHVFLDQWTGGDAFVTLPDPTDKNIVYYEHQHGVMLRMDITGNVLTGGPSTKHIRPRGPRNDRWRFSWYMPFLISKYDPKTLFAGGNKVVRSNNRGDTWQAISPDLADKAGGERAAIPFGTITRLAESPRQRGLLYAGTEGGSLHVTQNGGSNWLEVGQSNSLPRKWVSRVVASQHMTSRVYLSHTGFREDDFNKYLFVSEDFGKNWRSITSNLPAESINVVREDPSNPEILYVGTDLGVYTTINRGKQWHSIRGNLPTTPVHDLVIHPREREIIIATHGRSLFVASVREIQDR